MEHHKRKSVVAVTAAAIAVLGGLVAYATHELQQVGSNWHQEWSESAHNFYPGARTQSTRTPCNNCHTGVGFIEVTRGGTLGALEQAPDYSITCRTCHNTDEAANMLHLRVSGDVQLPNGVTVSAGISGACMTCHNSRIADPEESARTGYRGPHYGPQTEILAGTGGIEYGRRIGSSVHTIVTFEGCVTCHKAGKPELGEYGATHIGGHSFRMSWDGETPEDPRDDIEHTGACQRCHPGLDTFDVTAKADYDGDGIVEGVQTEVHGLLDRVAEFLPRNAAGETAIPSDLTQTTVEQRRAFHNWKLVAKDGSYGVHNTAYAVNLLRTTYRQMSGAALPGADALGSTMVANRPDVSETIEDFEESWARSPHNFDPADFHGAPQNPSCVKCHNGEWFVKMQAQGLPGPDATLEVAPTLGHTCNVCHNTEDPVDILSVRVTEPVTLPNGTVVDGGRANLCMRCHNGRRPDPVAQAQTSFRGPHAGPQAEMFAGTGVVTFGRTLRNSAHVNAVPDLCVTCHMTETLPPTQRGHRQVGAHTLKLEWDGGTPDNPNDDIKHVAACQGCHPDVTAETGFDRKAREDFDADGTIEGVQTEVKGLLAMVASELPHDDQGNVAIPSDLTLTTVEQRMANYNYQFVVNDRSNGVHNALFTADLLRATYEELTGDSLEPATATGPRYDVNGDGIVNVIDLIIVGQHFGQRITPAVAALLPSDVDGSGSVDRGDLRSLSTAIGATGSVDAAASDVGPSSVAAWLALERLPMDDDGALFRVKVRVNSADRVAGYQLSLDYDPTVMTLVGLGNGSYLARDTNAVFWQTPVVKESSGRIESAVAVALGADPIPGLGNDLTQVTFRVHRLDARLEGAVRLRSIQLADRQAELMRVDVGPSRVDSTGALWRTVLLPNYPNPFNPETWIPFDLAQSANVRVDIMTMSGEAVRRIDLGWLESGAYRGRSRAAYWDGTNESGERVASGVYFYRIQAGSYSAGRKLVVQK